LANRFPSIRISRGDVLRLVIRQRFDVVLANLFSDVLVAAASRIARATKPGGWLIFSGVLRTQRREVISAFQAAGFTKPRIIVRGKWCAGACRRNG
jgi:ribosomal protein L11 methyltransferase